MISFNDYFDVKRLNHLSVVVENNMPQPHLTAGSQQPPKIADKLRLYSMEYCPYAHRVRLILNVKKIPHDIVNINLINQPEWYFKIHPQGYVPALDTGSQIVIESLDICDFLDDKYPSPPLYPSDAPSKNLDKALLKKIQPLHSVFLRCISLNENKSLEEWAQEFLPHLQTFEMELCQRGSRFFGGEKPGMVDYMLWPWGERAGTVVIAHGRQLPFASDQFPRLREWRKAMRGDPVCEGLYYGPEKYWKIIQIKLRRAPPEYDTL
ncbi:pyrimidodiazepine synthase-like [Tribolium madens]|uniref:pyrimidodiazepine synthase-like n=1 Tax=Tribolium madens TaxID=41895 RepID=UPI001CF72FB5|nr:pyrimidodiazepine synthase-like [Tribolium madens]